MKNKTNREIKIKQITASTGFNGKQYTLVVTECGKLYEFIQTLEGEEEWRLITPPLTRE